MKQYFGIIFLDEAEIIFRIYETTDQEWKLFHYHSALLPEKKPVDISAILEIIGVFFTSDYAQNIAEWKIGCRQYPKELTVTLSKALDMPVEDISLHREQELICKGMFTELW